MDATTPDPPRSSGPRLTLASVVGVPVRGMPVPLRSGDVLLYSGRGIFSTLIKLKTWSSISHVEIVGYDPTTSYASRDGIGVGTYDVRRHDLVMVVRPRRRVRVEAMRSFHERCCEPPQKYDYWGLLRFFNFKSPKHDRQFCSEYAVRLLRAGGIIPFAEDCDADSVPPGWFAICPPSIMWVTWRRAEKT